jgi:hypothetical protein
MEPEPVHIRIQLAEIFVGKCVNFQLDQNVAFQDTVIKDQIDKEMLPSDENAFFALPQNRNPGPVREGTPATG